MNKESHIMRTYFNNIRFVALCGASLIAVASLARAADIGRTFATPEDAAKALGAAANAKDRDALRAIFGPSVSDVQNPDPVQATNEVASFAAAMTVTNRLVRESNDKFVLEVGKDFWPFPIPIVKKDGVWLFDTDAGKEELLNRRIGRNELSTLATVRAYVDAQREYSSRDHDGNEVLQFAQKIVSTPGKKDGLYWSPDLDGTLSPLGPLVASAQGEGYGSDLQNEDRVPAPYHGYYFKILTGQGRHAPGGRYNYVINGNMIAGFALVAWPAEYGDSGIMTFIVNQQGRVYQKDMGPNTTRLAKAMKQYDPDPTWRLSPD